MCQILSQVLGYSSELQAHKFSAVWELTLSSVTCILSQLSVNYNLLKYDVTTEVLFS